jgi:hypothetical protein
MMPKEVLTDAAIRAEVVPGLSLRRICQLLQRFVSDDFAPDPLPPGAPVLARRAAAAAMPVLAHTACPWRAHQDSLCFREGSPALGC